MNFFKMIKRTKIVSGILLVTAIILMSFTLSVFVNAEGVGLTTLEENFDDVSTLTSRGWVRKNNSDNTEGSTNWFQGNDGTFGSHAGEPIAYIAANYNNTLGNGTISNWLITPELLLINGSVFSFWTRCFSGEFPDRLEVRLSTDGAEVGDTSDSVGDFGTLLLSVNPNLDSSSYPEVWTEYEVNISGLSAPVRGRIALRYFVTNGGIEGNNSNYIGIDAVSFAAAIADLDLSLSVSDAAPAMGDRVTFTVAVTNDGPSDAENISVSIPLLAAYEFISAATLTGTYDSDSNIWTVGDLANGDAATLTIEVDIDTIEDLEITATASSDLMAPDAFNNTSSVFVTPQLVASISGPVSLTLTEAYAAMSTNIFTIAGKPTSTVVQDDDYDGKILWNDETKQLDIAEGLAPGKYPVVLTASNGVEPDATLSFVLTVNAAPTINGDEALTLTGGNDATATSAYAVSGYPAPSVRQDKDYDGKILWNDETKQLDI
ncbi:MAG TPA: DUF11 domain-containing protein, partial [Clostridiaceae bacterium]|nr:DUF11 domain-containing protein [Clostridiaceae bacterium]